MLCLCIIHGPTLLDLSHADYRPNRCFSQPGEKRLYTRSPSLYCSTCLLLPIFSTGATGIVDSARLYIQSIVDRQGQENFSTFYTQLFFQAVVLKNLL